MRKFVKVLIVAGVLIACLVLLFTIPVLINNHHADKMLTQLEGLPLPSNTELCDGISLAGKISGNGNGIQYFAAILIRSNLSLAALNDYYQQYQIEGRLLDVEAQTSPELAAGLNRPVSFDHLINATDFTNYYIVYAYDYTNSFFLHFDIRTH